MGMSRASLFLLLGAGGLAGVGCASRGSAAPKPFLMKGAAHPAKAIDSLRHLAASYRKGHKVNGTPILMEPQISYLCRGPMTWELADNPHQPKFFTVYLNGVGKEE